MSETYKFMDEGWIQKYMEEYNKDQELINSLKDFSALVEMGILDGDKRSFFYLVENGKGVKASLTNPTDKKPDFRIFAKIDTWRKIAEGKTGVKSAIITRKIKFEGPMSVAMKYMRGLTGALTTFGKVPTDWNI